MRLIALFVFTAAIATAADSFSGFLVDSTCYTESKQNTNKYPMTGDGAMTSAVKQCAPNEKTKVFALVLPDWTSVRLSPSANASAAKVVSDSPNESLFPVTVIGQREGRRLIKVDSISLKQ